jgi:cytoplasmic tRNA 2-thiolation protein 1
MKKLEAEGPPPENLRTIPFFKQPSQQPPSGRPAVAIEASS